ncbi:tetratricopeptide repeat protein [Allokutzneria oryzae]|uniref:Tetratricopeptide repeat protein n=1 Tax=Allokutzneria oryzae TaxID=1378989 RepID=A0ABV6ACZ0_9PSEU
MSGVEGARHEESTVDNVISGAVQGQIVQAGVVHGDVHLHGAVPSARPVPQQLPSEPVVFASREPELARLDRVLRESDDRLTLVVVSGAGGVGKTALALRWMHSVADRFADGQLYIDLGGFSGGEPLEPVDALGQFLRALGVAAERVPVGLAERTAMFRSLTADMSLALLLDNAFAAAQVRPLLPRSPRSAVVVTSRKRLVSLTIDGAVPVSLAPLNGRDSVQLLTGIVGKRRAQEEPESADALARLCGGLPIALSVVAARLRNRPQWSLAKVVTDLHDERRRLSKLSIVDELSVTAVFDASYRRLREPDATLYRLLSWHPGGEFDVELAAATADRPSDEVEDSLDSLVDASLLNETRLHRFHFHDLLRLHARTQVDDEEEAVRERRAARMRMSEWYLDRALVADRVLMPKRWRVGTRYERVADRTDFADEQAALDWFETELDNLMRVLRYVRYHRAHDLAWQLCEAMWGFFLYRKHYRDWISAYENGILSAREDTNPRAEAHLRCHLGFAYLNLNDFDRAAQECTHALELAERTGEDRIIATAASRLGMAERARGRLGSATDCFQRALAIDERTGNRRGEALRRRRLGEMLADAGRFPEAIAELDRARDLLDRLDDGPTEARVLSFLGSTYRRAGRLDDARRVLNDAVARLRAAGMTVYEADALTALGEVAEDAGDLPQAIKLLSRARAIYAKVSDAPQTRQLDDRLDRLRASLA